MITLLILIFCFNSYSDDSKIMTLTDLKTIESEIQVKLESKVSTAKDKFYINLLAGRELYQFRFYEKSERYYREAIQSNVSENKTEAYINLIAISIEQKNKSKVATELVEAKKYFIKNPSLMKSEIKYYLNSIDGYLGNSSEPIRGFYARFNQEENLIGMLKNKEFIKAFSSLKPESLKESNNSLEIIIYDSLNVLVNKKAAKNLYCEADYKKYPDSYSYSILICGLLHDYLQNGYFDKNRLVRAEAFFKEEASDKKYLLDMVKEIK
jgi:hypothetical protein